MLACFGKSAQPNKVVMKPAAAQSAYDAHARRAGPDRSVVGCAIESAPTNARQERPGAIERMLSGGKGK